MAIRFKRRFALSNHNSLFHKKLHFQPDEGDITIMVYIAQITLIPLSKGEVTPGVLGFAELNGA